MYTPPGEGAVYLRTSQLASRTQRHTEVHASLEDGFTARALRRRCPSVVSRDTVAPSFRCSRANEASTAGRFLYLSVRSLSPRSFPPRLDRARRFRAALCAARALSRRGTMRYRYVLHVCHQHVFIAMYYGRARTTHVCNRSARTCTTKSAVQRERCNRGAHGEKGKRTWSASERGALESGKERERVVAGEIEE